MIDVQGVLDGVAYDVTLTGDPVRPVTGSARVAAWVEFAIESGRVLLAGPTGPRVQVRAQDPTSIVALLAATGRVTAVSGAAPAAGNGGTVIT